MKRFILSIALLIGGTALAPPATADPLDLSHAYVVVKGRHAGTIGQKAAKVLVEEVATRTGLRWVIAEKAPRGVAVITLSAKGAEPETAPRYDGKDPTEAFTLQAKRRRGSPAVSIEADLPHALFFGVGALLAKADWTQGRFSIPEGLQHTVRPAFPLRGHQLGYRAAANSWDAWDIPQFEQHIRELTFFGTNAIENIPFQDERKSSHFKVARRDMNRAMSEICAEYGLQYWLWTPATIDLKDHEKRAEHLREHEQLYADCPRIDGIFFPGGDPGDNPPDLVLPFLAEVGDRLLRAHPRARVWISLQGFTPEEDQIIYNWAAGPRPPWFGGIVAGPSSPPLTQIRTQLDPKVPLRDYPDITHTTRCQYPIPWWDPAFALTLGREAINPRPSFYNDVIQAFAKNTIGFISYSDGVNDDVNKALWSQLHMAPKTPVRDLLRDYANIFFGTNQAQAIADAILALEQNWNGSLATNQNVEKTLDTWRALAHAEPRLDAQWRGQMLLVRAEYDAYTRRRLLAETAREAEWNAQIDRLTTRQTSDAILAQLRDAINAPVTFPDATTLRDSIVNRFDVLYRQIQLQSSVEKYQASGSERGCSLDFLDYPLNNRWWLEDQLAQIKAEYPETDTNARLARLQTIARWEDPGTGGFYDVMGHPGRGPRISRETEAKTYPDIEYSNKPTQVWDNNGYSRLRLTWQTFMDWPTALIYEDLDPEADYLFRCTGQGNALPSADGLPLTHSRYGTKTGDIKEFPIPRQATADGTLRITFQTPGGEEHLNWRQQSRINEAWLNKVKK